VAGEGGRFEGALSAALSAEYVGISDDGPRVVPGFLGTSRTEFVRDSLYMNASASVAELQLSPSAATSASSRNDINRALVQNYELSPLAITRIEDVAYVQSRYILAGIVAGDS
jgi:hypothetical protein